MRDASDDGISGRNVEKLDAIPKRRFCSPQAMRRSLVDSKLSGNHHSVPSATGGHALSELHLPNVKTFLMLAFFPSPMSESDRSAAGGGTRNDHGMLAMRTLKFAAKQQTYSRSEQTQHWHLLSINSIVGDIHCQSMPLLEHECTSSLGQIERQCLYGRLEKT